ncbi:MAG: SpaA isopeptide-forming pilin-related protein [Lachnospiraceae bacterium]
MSSEFDLQKRELNKDHSRKRVWRNIIGILMIITVFMTTYALILPAITQEQIYCGMGEHVHSAEDGCYAETKTFLCGLEESDGNHIHTESCYESILELTCTQEEHTHTVSCYSDPNANVESSAVWEGSFEHITLTGIWADDVISIAETQLGYTESSTNYIVDENNNIHGYTRYGEWFGSPYSDWSGMFVSFCLNYAAVNPEQMPINASCSSWVDSLTELGLYRDRTYSPEKGDLIFFDKNSDGHADHIGLVSSADLNEIRIIEGDADKHVQYASYNPYSADIFCFVALPVNPDVSDIPIGNTEIETNTEETNTEEINTEGINGSEESIENNDDTFIISAVPEDVFNIGITATNEVFSSVTVQKSVIDTSNTIGAKEFTFHVQPADSMGNIITSETMKHEFKTVSCIANETTTIKNIGKAKYDTTGTYYILITETISTDSNWTFDTTQWLQKVVITLDPLTQKLIATETYKNLTNGGEYSSTVPLFTNVYTSNFMFYKTDTSGNNLSDAGFTLYHCTENSTDHTHDGDCTWDSSSMVQSEVFADTDGDVHFSGLDFNAYYILVETTPPAGYAAPSVGSYILVHMLADKTYTLTGYGDFAQNSVSTINGSYYVKNNILKYTLKLTKSVIRAPVGINPTFTFETVIKNSSGDILIPSESNIVLYDGSGNIRTGELTINTVTGVVTAELGDGYSLEITKIPANYTAAIEETGNEDYDTEWTADGGTTTNQTSIADIIMTSNKTVDFTNTRSAANLTITKTVQGTTTTSFPFEVTFVDDIGDPVQIPNDTASPAAYTVDPVSPFKVTFSLANSESVSIVGVPIDSVVSLSETSHDGYTVQINDTTSGGTVLSRTDSVTITLDADKAVEVINNPGIVLPATGGPGRYIFVIGGITILICVFGIGFFVRYKRERGTK